MIPLKAITFSKPSPWVKEHLREDFDICDFRPGARVLDVGCGFGKNLETMRAKGIDAVGVDPDSEGLSYCLTLGLNAHRAHAEHLPFPAASFDGLIFDGVLQFTDPQKGLSEAHRVLLPGGKVKLVVQGIGYALHVIHTRRGIGRLFGVRMILSTLWHKITGQRIGDTVCFSPRSIKAQCERSGFRVDLIIEGNRYFGLPVFVYLQAQRQ